MPAFTSAHAGSDVRRASRARRSSRSRAWGFLAIAVLTEVTATLSLKGALTHPLLYTVVVAGYVTAFTALAYALRAGLGLGVAYGVWGACGVALTALASMWVFGEPLSAMMGVGIALVIGGVLCVELGSREQHA